MRLVFYLLILSSTLSYAQKLEQLGAAINTEYSEIHPLISPDALTLYFVRVSHPSNNFGKDGSNDVWYADFRPDGRWGVARKMANSVNKDKYNDLFSISPDGNTLLVRGVYINGKKENEVGISMCKKTGTGWSQPNKVDIPKLDAMCKGQYLTAFLSNNGKSMILAFSEKKNSKEDDLYISLVDKAGKWSKPESLGSDINTGSSETTPFLASDNNTLYFASDRKGGVGGLDIWVSKRKGRGWNSWSKPVNLGDKINSDLDDMYYTITASGEYAYMATRKNAVGKSDIVRFKLRDDKVKEAEVASLQSSDAGQPGQKKEDKKEKAEDILNTAPTAVVMLSGIVLDSKTGKPIEAKIIYETLPDGEEAGVAYSNPTTGEYKIILPYGSRYAIRAEANDFISISKSVDLTIPGDFKELKGEDLTLAPIQTGVTVGLNNIFFQFGKAKLQEESYFELDRLTTLLNQNPNMTIEVQGHTDNVGSDESNLKLSQERADAVRDYIVSKKVPLIRVRSVGFGESKPIATNQTTEGQAKNRRVEFVIIRK
jgi:OOP family OmpA-OmpF porin